MNTGATFAKAMKAGESPRWISIMGESGTGKTHMARKLWDAFWRAQDWARCEYLASPVYWPAFISKLRGGNGYEMLADMQRWPVLFLDDIGAERDTTGFASEQLNTLLGCRVGKWTILTSNLLLEQIGAIDPRIADRIIRKPNIFCEVKTTSHALRTIKANQ